jgi:hypothetical protein
MVMIVVMAMTAAAAFTVFMVVVMIVLAMYVAMSQFFSGSFADRDNFHVEVQVLTRQHVVTVNHYVVAVHFGDFDRHWALIGISQEAHTHFQLVNAHKDVFRHALHQVFVVVAVRIVSANIHVKTIARFVAFECFFQTRNQ